MESDDSRADGLRHSSCPNLMEGPSHRVFPAWGQPWKRAQEGLTLVDAPFLCLQPTGRRSMAHLMMRGRERDKGGAKRQMWVAPEISTRGPFRNDFPRVMWLRRDADRMDTRSAQLQNPHSPNHNPLGYKCSLANKTPLRLQVAVE